MIKIKSEDLAIRIRRHAIKMTHDARASHIASILSVADIVAVLYADVMEIYPEDPNNNNRDRLVLSKGHAGVAIYAALAEMGYFPLTDLDNYCANGSYLSGHISHKNIEGVEFSTGSLGHGACVACGMAISAKFDEKTHQIYSIIGDGECNEGSIWEMAMLANQLKLDNLTIVVDNNKFQAMGDCQGISDPIDLKRKWGAFGWNAIEINGHAYGELKASLTSRIVDKPTCIIANTVKGKGVSFMENQIAWHYRDPQGEDYTNAIKELASIR